MWSPVRERTVTHHRRPPSRTALGRATSRRSFSYPRRRSEKRSLGRASASARQSRDSQHPQGSGSERFATGRTPSSYGESAHIAGRRLGASHSFGRRTGPGCRQTMQRSLVTVCLPTRMVLDELLEGHVGDREVLVAARERAGEGCATPNRRPADPPTRRTASPPARLLTKHRSGRLRTRKPAARGTSADNEATATYYRKRDPKPTTQSCSEPRQQRPIEARPARGSRLSPARLPERTAWSCRFGAQGSQAARMESRSR